MIKNSKYFKRCFSCKRLKPLMWFKINPRKYQLPSDKGRAVDCRLCTCKKFIRQNGEFIKHNPTSNKYDTIVLQVNLINILKIYFK